MIASIVITFLKEHVFYLLFPKQKRTLNLPCIWLQVVGTLYTHHQKCVIVDTQASGNNRKLSAFIGGLDLCDGRYDTPEHRLFRDLNTVFQDDYHNPTLPVSICSIRTYEISLYRSNCYAACDWLLGNNLVESGFL